MGAIKATVSIFITAVLDGCSGQSATGLNIGAASANNLHVEREVTVQVQADNQITGFTPELSGHTLLAESVVMKQVARAEAHYSIDGVPVVLLGSSCEALRASHADTITDCLEEAVQRQTFEPAIQVGRTNPQGIANLLLKTGSIRLRVEGVNTLEDAKCWWSGSVILPPTQTFVELPLAVYCE